MMRASISALSFPRLSRRGISPDNLSFSRLCNFRSHLMPLFTIYCWPQRGLFKDVHAFDVGWNYRISLHSAPSIREGIRLCDHSLDSNRCVDWKRKGRLERSWRINLPKCYLYSIAVIYNFTPPRLVNRATTTRARSFVLLTTAYEDNTIAGASRSGIRTAYNWK